jgi:hypothetical protein
MCRVYAPLPTTTATATAAAAVVPLLQLSVCESISLLTGSCIGAE